MRRYFLTGCTGFLGREIVRKLLLKPDTESICCLTREIKPIHITHPKVSYVVGNIGWCALPDRECTDIIHGANDANDLEQADQYGHYFTIVEGTRRILEWVKWLDAPRVLILSSGAATRNTIYGKAKKLCEELAVNHKIARIFSVIGSEMPLNSQFAAGQFVRQALQGKIEYYGGDSTRTYLDVSDCAVWLLKILDQGTNLYPYDVAGDTQIRIEDLAKAIGNEFSVPVAKINGPDRVDSYSPNLDAAHSMGLTQTITLEQSLEKIHAHICHTHK